MRKCHVPTPPTLLFFVGLAAFFLLGGPRLPRSFETLSLEEKVAAYEEFLRARGIPQDTAQAQMAWHGWAAADLMAEYVSGERVGLPRHEAIIIIRYVQWRGCSLQGSAAEDALAAFPETGTRNSLERHQAESTLRGIRENVDLSDLMSYPRGGPCQEGKEASSETQ